MPPEVTIIGKAWCQKSYVIRDFFYRQGHEADWLDADSGAAAGLPSDIEYPIVALSDGRLLQNPTLEDLAGISGYHTEPSKSVYDLVILGAGPAGLSAGVYAGSEGLSTLLVDSFVPGGQAGSTSYIENLLGYPQGVSGCDFASDAVAHVLRFGNVELLCPVRIETLRRDGQRNIIGCKFANKGEVVAKTVLISTGASYRYLDVPGCETFMNQGVYYGASLGEANRFSGKSIVIVGGGNSAGQAAIHFAAYCRKVRMVVRRESLADTMSDYLIKRIEQTRNIELIPDTELVRVSGDDSVHSVRLRNKRTGRSHRYVAQGVFIFIGALPNTEWLDSVESLRSGISIALSPDGYIYTGARVSSELSHATSVPGIFAAGDCRYGSTKRVATAVGEGATVVAEVHRYLAQAVTGGV
jgi:thioredoxin reductase (NADPH)